MEKIPKVTDKEAALALFERGDPELEEDPRISVASGTEEVADSAT